MTLQIISCYAPYGDGGLGRYLQQFVDAAKIDGSLSHYFCKQPQEKDPLGSAINPAGLSTLFRIPPFRNDLGLKDWAGGALFDRAVARQLPPAEVLHVFNGKALESMRAARRLGYKKIILESANSHADNIRQQHRQAYRRFPFEKPWLHRLQHQRMLLEYELADEIWCASQYSWDTFIGAGISSAKLRRRPFHIHPRFFDAPISTPTQDRFTMIAIGRLDITKGVPLLKSLLNQINTPDVRLILMGGTGSRGMNRFMSHWVKTDHRVEVVTGDPLPYLAQAHVLLHPSYEDGFALAPVEALASGVPVIVTEDTGMKELVQPGVNGLIVPTGNEEALRGAVQQIQQNPLRGETVRDSVLGQYAAAS